MKKNGFTRRTISLLLVIMMVIQVLPLGVLAAKGDIVSLEDIGFDPETQNQKGAINWPIKIYDYLNDGMLFEPANSRADSASASVVGRKYGGGRVMPLTTLGTDFTTTAGSSANAYTWSADKAPTANYAVRMVAAERFVSPKHIHVSYPGAGTYAYQMLHSFTKVTSASTQTAEVAKESARYMVLVYRANGRDSDERIDLRLEHNSGIYNYYGYEASNTVGLPIRDTDTWTALVVDLAEVVGASTWSTMTTVSGAYMLSGMADTGDYIDISHVAFFNNEVEARNYANDAVAFDKDPGEHLEVTQTITLQGGEVVEEYYPNVNEPGFDLGLGSKYVYGTYAAPSSQVATTDANYKYRFGLNFALGIGQSSTTVAKWDAPSAISLRNGSSRTSFTPTDMTVKKVDDGARDYVSLSSSAAVSNIILSSFDEGNATNGAYSARVAYLVLVYRANGCGGERAGFWGTGYKSNGFTGDTTSVYAGYSANANNWSSATGGVAMTLQSSPHEGVWVYDIVNLNQLGISRTYWKHIGMYLPSGAGKSLDLAYIGYFADPNTADVFGKAASGYMNVGKVMGEGVSDATTKTLKAGRTWNMGNNLGYGLLFASDGPGWTNLAGGNNTNPNGYYSYAIGYDMRNGQDTATSAVNKNRKDFQGKLYSSTGGSNKVYMLQSQNMPNFAANGYYDMSALDFDGYTLKQIITQGWMTTGMLEGRLEDGKPVYRQETVEYVANLLYETLVIPPFDSDGDYNYNYVKGEKSSQFAFDINGDGDLEDRVDLTGDGYAETMEASMDLATALRLCLGVKFSYGQNKGTYQGGSAVRGTYADTLTRAGRLSGPFNEVRGSITTCVDAAYYLLNSIFVGGSYNQVQNDYNYLTLSSAVLDDGREAYVFDAGYTTGTGSISDAGYKENSQSALVYSPYVQIVDGQPVYGNGTISLKGVSAKDLISIADDDQSNTTRFPFLPVTDPEGDYPKDTESYYFGDDGVSPFGEEGETYENRNYNYVMASNGEFVYYEEDALFFEFEGDDDVYLFINDQLVLDIGGAHGISKAKIDVNAYVQWARELKADTDAYGALSAAEQERVDALALTEGEICSFDFYYMERHGYGANCRIVTNMHVTDPSLNVEKKATQFGQNVEFGGVVDASAAIGYEFKLTNTGNTKLYNMTFTDDVIGVTLDPQKGLVVKSGMNGSHVRDKDGGMLDATDLLATVSGEDANGTFITVDIGFRSNEELINFLRTLQAEGTQSGFDDSELTHAGSGLWVDATVSIKGIYYVMTLDQVEQGGMENIVYVTATTKTDPSDSGNETLRSDAKHRVYTSGAPVYYQWAGHGMFLPGQKLLDDSTHEAGMLDSQLNKYQEFFLAANHDTGNIWTGLCDKHGNGMGDRNDTGMSQRYNAIEAYTDPDTSDWGYLVEYDKAGTYSFYVLMYLNEQKGGYPSGTSVANMEEGKYAIIRLTVYVADVEDSTFVLDYGLQTESLDVGGELFKNDELFGSSGTMTAKLMGVSLTQPWYQYVKDVTTSDYNRISFAPMSENEMKNIPFTDGHYSMNLAIGPDGKEITYNAGNGQYSLTDVGTMRINADVPADWDDVRLYYWHDNGANNGWPGTAMTKVDEGGSKYYLDIPADVGYVIVNNGNDTQQTNDLRVTPGMESSITVSPRPEGHTYYPAVVSNVVKSADAHVKAPADWEKVYLYCWRDNGQQIVDWPGVEMEKGSDGLYSGLISSETSYVIVNNGDNYKQSNDIDVLAGKEVWISLDSLSYTTRDDGVALYTATCAYTQNSYPVHIRVPDNWESAYLHYWLTGTDQQLIQWPGAEMTRGNDGWYTTSIPAGVSYMVVNCGPEADGQVPYQTVNLTVNAGMEAWIAVADESSYSNDSGVGFHEAKVVYGAEGQQAGFSFTPDRIMKEESSLWLALTVHTTGANPSTLGSGKIDVNNEVQMFKKVTVLPANVVYYEDDFKDLQYSYGTGAFTHHGEGSGKLTQQVDQSQPYGQDKTYQAGSNVEMSGDSMSQLLVQSKTDTSGVSFTFTGTGFELIGRTDAKDCATIIVKVEKLVGDATELIQYTPVIPEFDNGNDGGNEAIAQVPVVRVKDLDHGTYRVTVTGSLAYDFDSWDGTSLDTLKVVPTQMYVDGVRIFQPLGATHDAYTATEKDAQFLELRDQVVDGLVAVAGVDKGEMTLSSGTMTWTEDLLGDDFDDASDVFVGNRVDSTGDYLIQGPNNEVYMEGAVSHSAVVFYVTETAQTSHELQIAVRGLDYERFFGVGNSPLSVQLQYGVKLSDGRYAWRVMADVHSGTEQYYTVPYTECPKDEQGRYQVVIRAVAPHQGDLPMVSYSTLKLVGLELQKVDGVGESTLMYYKDGMIVSPDYWLVVGDKEYEIEGGELDISFETDTEVFIRQEFEGFTTYYRADVALGTTSATLPVNGSGAMTVPGGVELTFKLVQSVQESVQLSYCAHTWEERQVIVPVSCTSDGSSRVVCTICGEGRVVTVPTKGHTMDPTGTYCTTCGYGCPHVWQDGVCSKCGGHCAHSWKDGACTVCGMPCEHTFGDGSVCTNCGIGCTHSWTDGKCDHCCTTCGHSWDIEKCTICGEDRGLYLFGWIDGRNYACEEDGSNIGIYGFTDRTLTTRFQQDSYVAVKTGDNGDWFMTNGYPGDNATSAVLYNTKQSIDDENKLRVPAGVDVTFTITPNGDGSLTLSYSVDLSTCGHASHGTNGLCVVCGKDMGHSFVNGYCTACGKAESDEYYLFGYINGADYACEGDSANRGIYRFVDGVLTAIFTQDSYVAVKTGDNQRWYMTNGWLGTNTTSATLYNTSSGFEANKLFVPRDKQITFYLTVNENDTLDLSYTVASPAMALNSLRSQMASTLLVGAANEGVTAPSPDPEPVVQPELKLDHPSLSFEDEVRYNVYYSASGLEDVTEMGLVTFGSRLEDGTVAQAVDVFPGYVSDGSSYMVRTEGIPAANMGDAVYFKVYAKLSDGSYVYSDVGGYSAKAYANTVLSGDYDSPMKALVVAMLNYGAEAQLYFDHNTDKLVNSALTAEQQALVDAYDTTMMDVIVKADSTKTGDFVRVNSNFKSLYPSVSFDGAFAINFYCTPAIDVDDGMKLYYWDMETMASVEKLSIENATGSMEMTDTNGMYWGQVAGIAAKEMDKTYYVTCVFESNGKTITTGIIPYSLGKYCSDKAAADGDAQQSFAQATAVYGYYAKAYFASIA